MQTRIKVLKNRVRIGRISLEMNSRSTIASLFRNRRVFREVTRVSVLTTLTRVTKLDSCEFSRVCIR